MQLIGHEVKLLTLASRVGRQRKAAVNCILCMQGEIMSCKFSPTGGTLASASYDRLICKITCNHRVSILYYRYTLFTMLCGYPLPDLWNVYGDCENYAVMKGHTGAIMELQYSYDGRQALVIYSETPINSDTKSGHPYITEIRVLGIN